MYTRSKEHFSVDRQNNEETKPLLKHNNMFHPNKELDFEIKLVGFYNDSLTRQINEGVRINNDNSTGGYCMNSKSEFRQGVVPRVTYTRGLNV